MKASPLLTSRTRPVNELLVKLMTRLGPLLDEPQKKELSKFVKDCRSVQGPTYVAVAIGPYRWVGTPRPSKTYRSARRNTTAHKRGAAKRAEKRKAKAA